MPLARLSDIEPLVNDLLTGRRKAIGFSCVPAAAYNYPLPLSYYLHTKNSAIPADRVYWQVKPNAALLEEDPGKVVVLLYFIGIEHAMAELYSLGEAYKRFTALPYFTYEYLAPFFPHLRALPTGYRRARQIKQSRHAILIRGGVMNEAALSAVQYTAAQHPDHRVVLSTWADTPEAYRKELETYVDDVVYCQRPANPGTTNRNYQLTHVQEGLKGLESSGAEKFWVLRTDIFNFQPHLLNVLDGMHECYDATLPKPRGARGRLLVPDLYTRTYIPYHFSDIMTFGWREDVEKFWLGMPLDPETPQVRGDMRPMQVSLTDTARNSGATECYFGKHYCRALGLELNYELEYYFRLLRDYFCVVSSRSMGMFWPRKLLNDQATITMPSGKVMQHGEWLQLHTRQKLASPEDEAIPNSTFLSMFI